MSASLWFHGNKENKSFFVFEVTCNNLVEITVVETFCVNLKILSAVSKKICFVVIVSEELLKITVD